MSLFLYTAKTFVVCYIALLGLMYVFQRRLLYIPSRAAPSLSGFEGVFEEAQTQTADGLSLTHWLAKRGKPYVLVLHGNAGNIEDRAHKFRFLADQGHSVMLISYRGYGGNPGRPSERDIISDSALALEWLLKKENISSKETVLLGESLGSGAAIALAAKYPVRGLIFDTVYSSIADVGQSVYPFIPVRWLLKDTWDSMSRIQKARAPSLFIHSKHDTVIPFRFAKKLFDAAGPPKQPLWLERSDHNDNLSHESVRQAILDFLQNLPQP